MTDHDYTAANFIRENFERRDRIAIVTIDRSPSPGPVAQTILPAEEVASERFLSHLRHENDAAKDIYISMSSFKNHALGRTKASVAEVRHVFLDIDENGPAALERLKSLPAPHHIIESSPERYQVIWSATGFSVESAEALMRSIGPEIGADKAVHDAARILRIPGYYSHKREEPFLVRDIATVAADKREYAPGDFPAFNVERAAPQLTRLMDFREWREQHQYYPHSAGHYYDPKGNIFTGERLFEQWQKESLTVPLSVPRDPNAQRVTTVGNGSQSEKDFGWVMRQLEKGRAARDIVMELAASRPDKPSPMYYATHTVENALRKHDYNQAMKIAQGTGIGSI